MIKSKQPKAITTQQCPKCQGELEKLLGKWLCRICDKDEYEKAKSKIAHRNVMLQDIINETYENSIDTSEKDAEEATL